MVRGLKKDRKVAVTLTKEQKEAKKAFIKKKIEKLSSSIKIPGPINQLKTNLEDSDEKRVLELFMKYRPENKKEKKERLLRNEDKSKTPKPILVKFGMKHIVELIKAKKVKLILFAADVVPATNVCFLPTLCKMFGVSYGIIDKQSKLGAIVNLKRAAVIGLEAVHDEDSALFKELIEMCDAMFMNKYEHHMTTIGGSHVKTNKLEGIE